MQDAPDFNKKLFQQLLARAANNPVQNDIGFDHDGALIRLTAAVAISRRKKSRSGSNVRIAIIADESTIIAAALAPSPVPPQHPQSFFDILANGNTALLRTSNDPSLDLGLQFECYGHVFKNNQTAKGCRRFFPAD